MVDITATMVKELRERTGAGLKDCKKALTENDGDLEAAVATIRKMGLSKLEKKSHRSTEEGHIGHIIRDDVAVMAEIVCETDFVAKNEKFQNFMKSILECAADGDFAEGDNIADQVVAGRQDDLGELIASCGENIQVRRVCRWQPQARVHAYVHDGGGAKIAGMVEIEGEHDDEYGKHMAMHVVAAAPEYLAPEDVPEDRLQSEKEIIAAQPDMAGKPENVVDKIVNGRLNKWYAQVCLTRQTWVHDDKSVVEKVNPKATVRRYLRWQVGEDLGA